MPFGIGCAIYLNQYAAGRIAHALRLVTDVMLGIPTIVTGAFVYALWVVEFGFSGYAGAIALAFVMVPLIVRATEEMLRLVPRDIHEASLALGVTKSRTIASVLLPTASAGIITGVMLAVARAMGETAPLLLTTLGNDLFMETNPGNRMSTLSLQIFGSATGGFPSAQARAWAGALVLITIVLLLTILARLVSRRSTHEQMSTPERPDLMEVPSASGSSTNGAIREPAAPFPQARRRQRRRGAWTSSTSMPGSARARSSPAST